MTREYHGRPSHAARPARGAPNLIGQRFERLVVIAAAPKIDHRSRWLCRCDCGALATTLAQCLKNGDQQSCGCLRRENARAMGRRQKFNIPKASRTTGSAKAHKSGRIADAFAAVFRAASDTTHVDRPGARVVRGSRY